MDALDFYGIDTIIHYNDTIKLNKILVIQLLCLRKSRTGVKWVKSRKTPKIVIRVVSMQHVVLIIIYATSIMSMGMIKNCISKGVGLLTSFGQEKTVYSSRAS